MTATTCSVKAFSSAGPSVPVRAAEILGLIVILAGLTAALCHEAWVTGITVDEPSHLLSSDLYWQRKDVLQPRDLPPLIKIAGGWVPWLLRMPLPAAADPVWKTRHEWNISQSMVQGFTAAQAQRIVFLSRLPLLMFPLLTAALLWWWGRGLFSPVTGLLLAMLFALEPTALGHGALFKNDLAATCGYLLFWYGMWRFWRIPGRLNLLLVSAGLLAALLAKLSMLILLPIACVIVPVRYFVATRKVRLAVVAVVVLLAIVYTGLIATVQFDTIRLGQTDFEQLRRDSNIPWWFVSAARVFAVLPAPAPLWVGTVSLFDSNGGGNQIYWFGDVRTGPVPLYFVGALAVKAPVALLLLVLFGGLVLLIRLRRRELGADWIFVAAPPLLYIGAASASSLQLGVRLILPALPFGILIAGAAVERLRRGRGAFILAALLAFFAVDATRIYPHGISYFNTVAGGPENGLRYLSDSNLDWGQDLASLAAWARRTGTTPLRLFYFGNDNPYRFLPPERIQVLAPPWDDNLVKGLLFQPEPGIYAVSGTLLPGAMFDRKYRDYFKVFRDMHPIDHAGYSIFIYRIPDLGTQKQ